MGVTPIAIFRMLAKEFDATTDAEVEQWLSLCTPLLSKKRFGNLHSQALALLTAHRMKMAGVGINTADDPLGDISNIGVGGIMRVGSYSEGETSVSFSNSAGQYTATDAELALTPYGLQYLSLRRMRLMPITSAGESHGRA